MPRTYRARSPWRPIRAIIATLLIYFSGVWALSAVISFDKTLRGMGRPEGLWREDVATLLTVGIWQLVTIALTIAVSALGRGRVKDVLALRPPVGGLRTYAVAIVMTVLLQVVIAVVMPLLFPAPAQAQPESTALLGDRWWVALLVIGVGAPLAEEFLFRGFLLSALVRRWGFWLSACITNAWWTFLHAGYSPAAFASVFVMGLLYSWQLWRSGSLRVPLLCHAVHNGLIIVVFGQLSIR
jgi:uncharacterized protein